MSQYCPKCGGKLEERFIEADERTRRVCRDCGAINYRNSKACVGVLAARDGQVLLAKVVGGAPHAGSDATELGWFALDAIPEDVAFNWARDALHLLRRRVTRSVPNLE